MNIFGDVKRDLTESFRLTRFYLVMLLILFEISFFLSFLPFTDLISGWITGYPIDERLLGAVLIAIFLRHVLYTNRSKKITLYALCVLYLVVVIIGACLLFMNVFFNMFIEIHHIQLYYLKDFIFPMLALFSLMRIERLKNIKVKKTVLLFEKQTINTVTNPKDQHD